MNMENENPQELELVVLPLQLMNDLLVYLGTKPHTEVEPYIIAIRRECKLVPKEDAKSNSEQHKVPATKLELKKPGK